MSNWIENNPQEEYPPPWFSNEDEPEPEVQGPSLKRTVIGIIAIIVVAVFLLIPVLQAEILQRRQESLPEGAFDRTALLFASAMLFGRSEGQAMLFASDGSSDDVRSVLRFVIDTPQPSSRARLQIRGAPCGRRDGDACFVGQIFDPARPMGSGIRFGIQQIDDEPTVIWVELDQTIV